MNPRGVAVLTALPAAPTSPSHGKPADVSKGSAKVTLLSGAVRAPAALWLGRRPRTLPRGALT